MEFASDQAEIFRHCNHPIVNFEDPNLNVSIPVFSIHGNHDDPCGVREKSCMDILSSNGFVNYFGKQTNLEEIKIPPILLKKGSNKLALYGLSHIRDERLERLFKNGKVRMYRPEENADDWFNIFVCHQNRENRPNTKHLSDEVIPEFIQLVIWGHEHKCLIDPQLSSKNNNTYISQPGSTVATSLCEGEAGSKYVGLLTINGKWFKMEPLELKTVRLMHFDTIKLSDCNIDVSNSRKTQDFVRQKIEDIILDLSVAHSGHPKQPKLPLIRLRIEYTCETQHFNCIQFGQEFQGRVVNSNSMILLRMEKKNVKKKPNCIDNDALSSIVDNPEMTKIEHIVTEYFKTASNEDMQLKILPVEGMAIAIDSFVNQSRVDAIKTIVAHQIKTVYDYMSKQEDVSEDNISDLITDFHNTCTEKSNEEANNVRKVINSQAQSATTSDIVDDQHSSTDEEENNSFSTTLNASGSHGKRGGRGSRGRRATTRARGGRARGQTKLNF